MAPKGMPMVQKGKAKAKGKASAKGKAKAKAKGVKKQVAKEPDNVVEEVEVPEEDANNAELGAGGGVVSIVPKPKAKAGAMRKKVFEEIGEKTIEDAISERKAIVQSAEAQMAEAAALEEAQQNQVNEAQAEYQKAKEGVEAAIEKETEFARSYRALKEKRQEALSKIDVERKELLESHKKFAMLEVLAMNHKKMEELEGKRRQATAAADAAKQHLLEQKQIEKDALEATRKALEETRQMQKAGFGKGAGRGTKRTSIAQAASPSKGAKVTIDMQDTVPATLSEDIE